MAGCPVEDRRKVAEAARSASPQSALAASCSGTGSITAVVWSVSAGLNASPTTITENPTGCGNPAPCPGISGSPVGIADMVGHQDGRLFLESRTALILKAAAGKEFRAAIRTPPGPRAADWVMPSPIVGMTKLSVALPPVRPPHAAVAASLPRCHRKSL